MTEKKCLLSRRTEGNKADIVAKLVSTAFKLLRKRKSREEKKRAKKFSHSDLFTKVSCQCAHGWYAGHKNIAWLAFRLVLPKQSYQYPEVDLNGPPSLLHFFYIFTPPRRCCCEQKVKAQGENVTSIPSLICYAFRAFHWFVNAANVKESFADSTNSKMIFYRKKSPKSHATFASYNKRMKRIASWRDSWFLILIPKWQHTNKQN